MISRCFWLHQHDSVEKRGEETNRYTHVIDVKLMLAFLLSFASPSAAVTAAAEAPFVVEGTVTSSS